VCVKELAGQDVARRCPYNVHKEDRLIREGKKLHKRGGAFHERGDEGSALPRGDNMQAGMAGRQTAVHKVSASWPQRAAPRPQANTASACSPNVPTPCRPAPAEACSPKVPTHFQLVLCCSRSPPLVTPQVQAPQVPIQAQATPVTHPAQAPCVPGRKHPLSLTTRKHPLSLTTRKHPL
jgi:hypothetical protein